MRSSFDDATFNDWLADYFLFLSNRIFKGSLIKLIHDSVAACVFNSRLKLTTLMTNISIRRLEIDVAARRSSQLEWIVEEHFWAGQVALLRRDAVGDGRSGVHLHNLLRCSEAVDGRLKRLFITLLDTFWFIKHLRTAVEEIVRRVLGRRLHGMKVKRWLFFAVDEQLIKLIFIVVEADVAHVNEHQVSKLELSAEPVDSVYKCTFLAEMRK